MHELVVMNIEDLQGTDMAKAASERQAEKLGKLFHDRIIVDADNNVIKGRHKVRSLLKMGVQTVEVVKIVPRAGQC